MPFSPGDVVQLKSGGPAMTVIAESDEGVRCIWHAEMAGEVRNAVIPAVCLDEIELDDEMFEVEDIEIEDEDLDDEDLDAGEGKQSVLPLPPQRKKRN